MNITVPKYVADKLDGLNENDFVFQTLKGSGPGGQHRNKRETAVRITHKKTGISAEASDSKSQIRNRANAFRKLVLALIEHYTEDHKKELSKERVRTYHEPRNNVKDHRTGIENDYVSTLDGDIDCFIDAMIEGSL